MLKRIISGAQTGVDRAAIDAAASWGLVTWGGTVPRGRLAEDGEIPAHYFDTDQIGCGLSEHSKSRDYKTRTLCNVKDSDATLILRFQGGGRVLSPGTKLTLKILDRNSKPYKVLDPSKSKNVPVAAEWICTTIIEEEGDLPGQDIHRDIEILNVAGPRETNSPGIYDSSLEFLKETLRYVHLCQRNKIRVWAP